MSMTLLLLLLAGQAEPPLVIRNVNVIPMTTAEPTVLHAHAVVIEDGRITWLGADAEVAIPAGAVVRDAAGGYLMPGLADMHAHMTAAQLSLFLANGVTTVRELNGSPTHLDLRDRIARGELLGPRLIVGSPLLTVGEWPVRHVVVPDPDSATSLAARLIEAGYDFFKIYDGLSQSTYDVLVAAARRANLPVTGHIPEAVGLDGVLAARQDLEHVEKITYATVRHDPDLRRIPDIVQRIHSAGIRVTPTLFSMKVLMHQGTAFFDSLYERPEMRHVDAGTLGWWNSLRRPGSTRPIDPNSRPARIHQFQRELTRQLFEAGVPLVLGTDSPNPLVVPGFGVHDEIATLIDAGIPAYAVLRMATAAAAEYLSRAGEFGVVAVGAAADLVLMHSNPIEQPAALREPAATLVRGRWLDGAELRSRW